jgi:hypothetical protein
MTVGSRQYYQGRRTGYESSGRRCTLCGKLVAACRCKCTWCGAPKWQLTGGEWTHHICGGKKCKTS